MRPDLVEDFAASHSQFFPWSLDLERYRGCFSYLRFSVSFINFYGHDILGCMNVKKKILFLYNGGTIGQIPTEMNGIIVSAPPKDAAIFKKAVDPIIQKFAEKFEIIYEVVTTKESSSMTPQDWEKLIFRVKKAQDEEGFDAVGIAHGTDTLAYTATALSFALPSDSRAERSAHSGVSYRFAKSCLSGRRRRKIQS